MEERDRDRGSEKYKSSKKKYKHRSRSRSRSKYSRSRSKTRSREKRKSDRYDRHDRQDRHDRSERRTKRSRSRSKSDLKKTNTIAASRTDRVSNFSNFSTAPTTDAIVSNVPNINPQAVALAQAAKVDRKLYIGNLPTGITPPTLVKLLNAALMQMKANTQSGDPVLSAWISTDGHYAFVEFRSAEEANNGFLLNNVMILDQPLKVGRPKTYTGALSMMEDGNICNTVGAVLQAGTMNAPAEGKKVQFPTKILCFAGMTRGINIEDEEEYKNVSEDIREECSKHGKVLSIVIPRKDVEDNPSPGTGNVYVEFQSVDDAREVRKQLTGRKYNFRTISMSYISEKKFERRDFDSDEINVPSQTSEK